MAVVNVCKNVKIYQLIYFSKTFAKSFSTASSYSEEKKLLHGSREDYVRDEGDEDIFYQIQHGKFF